MKQSRIPVFLLGAGFNRDARSEVPTITGRSINIGDYEIQCQYPTAAEALKISFGLDELPAGTSIEDLYAQSMKESNGEPMKKLCDELMKADYYLVSRLRENSQSSYYRFFSKFGTARFLTFNYDALTEAFLLKLGTWFPHDGYGVEVDVEVGYNKGGLSLDNRSQTHVLHLHGSFCIYPSDAYVKWDDNERFGDIRLRERPKYIFDPDSVGSLFYPFERMIPALGYVEPARRVIAPIPNKATGLRAEFIRDVYTQANHVLENAELVVAVGYSFGLTDRDSYASLLGSFWSADRRKTIAVVDPNASLITQRMREGFQTLRWVPINLSFASWAAAGFPYEDV